MTPTAVHVIVQVLIWIGMGYCLVCVLLTRLTRRRLMAEAREQILKERELAEKKRLAKLERDALRPRDPFHIHKPETIETVDGVIVGHMCSECLNLCSPRQPRRFEVETEEHYELGSEEPIASLEFRVPVYDD